MVGAPMGVAAAVGIPAFVEGCSDDVPVCAGPCGGSSGPIFYDAGDSGDASDAAMIDDAPDASDADVDARAAGGPSAPPDLPFLAA